MRRPTDEKGFTLIEVIVSLVIIGMLAAVMGLGLVQITAGYVFARQNSETIQRSQIAMSRIVKELRTVCSTDIAACSPPPGISAATVNSISYKRRTAPDNAAISSHSIALAGSLLQIDSTTLISKVSAFTLAYYDASGNSLSAPVTATESIGRIDVSFTVLGANNEPATFTNSIDIRESFW